MSSEDEKGEPPDQSNLREKEAGYGESAVSWLVRKQWRAVNGPTLIGSDPVTVSFQGERFRRLLGGQGPVAEFRLAWLDPEDGRSVIPLGGFQFSTLIPEDWLLGREKKEVSEQNYEAPVSFDKQGYPRIETDREFQWVAMPANCGMRTLSFHRVGGSITVDRDCWFGTYKQHTFRLDEPDSSTAPWELPPLWVEKVLGHSVEEILLSFVIGDDREMKEWIRNNPGVLDGPLTGSVAYHRNSLLTHAWDNHKMERDLYSRQQGWWHMYKLRD